MGRGYVKHSVFTKRSWRGALRFGRLAKRLVGGRRIEEMIDGML